MENYWLNEVIMFKYIDKIFVLYIEGICEILLLKKFDVYVFCYFLGRWYKELE